MAKLICPSCGKSNPLKVDICQYCGTALKHSATEPLDPIQPGELPKKRKTSDLENTLPGWLRSARKAERPEDAASDLTQDGLPGNPAGKKQSGSPTDFLAGLSQLNDDDDETPDWLKGLQDSLPSATTSSNPPETEQPAPESELAVPTDEGFQSGSPFQFDVDNEAVQLSAENTPDWLDTLKAQDQSSQPTPVIQAPVNQPQAQGDLPPMGDLPDWLSALTAEPPARTVQTPATGQPAASEPAPDWLAGLGGDFTADETSGQADSVADAAPDWLSRMDDPSAAIPMQAVEMPEETDTPADLPTWLEGLSSTPAASESLAAILTPVEDMLDWMRDMQSATPAVAAVTASESLAAIPTPVEDMPDWMKELQAPTPAEAAQASTEAPAADDMPDWMKELQALGPVEAAQDSQAAPEAPAAILTPVEDMPDWMRDMQSATPAADVQAAPEASAENASDLLSAMPFMAGITPQTGTPSSADLPDWLNEATGEKTVIPGETTGPFGSDAIDNYALSGGLDETPDWLSALGIPSTSSGIASPQDIQKPDSEEVDFFGVGLPDWLGGAAVGDGSLEALPELPKEVSKDLPVQLPAVPGGAPIAGAQSEPTLATSSDAENIDSIFSMDMPEWLSGFSAADVNQNAATKAATTLEDSGLSPAELPSWVQAMRPMEAVMAEAGENEDDQDVENNGPLVGLRSVLPVQSGMPSEHKSKPYGLKLSTSETQQAQAALLESLLTSESTPKKVAGRAKQTGSRPLRWLIAVLLLLIILLSLILGTLLFPRAQVMPDQSPVSAFISVANGLSPNAPVLVVVDYQPGFAGELEAAAGPVIEQLTKKNIPIAFISTSPVGPYLADRLQKKYASGYQLNTNYVNLGYLSGDGVGIKAFAEQPAATVGLDSVLGNMWAAPALAGATINTATRLSNFGAIIVMTDNPDTGRLWIEQAHPLTNTSPMLMVVSAQAEPMIRPYMASGQVEGMVAGLEGAAIYENALGTTANSGIRPYWDAFGMAMLTAESSILIGGIWSFISGWRSRRATTEQDEV